MRDYLTARVTDLAFENALLRLRCQDLIDIIEGMQRFGTMGRFDADTLLSAKSSLAEIVAANARRKAEAS